MNAVAIGPLVFAPDRFAAIVAIAVFLLLSEILARKTDRRLSSWGWGATIAFIVGARAGHVIKHGESFLTEPLRVFYLWQGGFMIAAGIVLALVLTLIWFRRELRLVLWAVLPALASACIALFILQLTGGAPAIALPSGNTFHTLAGEPFEPETLQGRPIVINLWASWCPPCRREMPMMVDVAASTGNAHMVFVNQGEGAETIQRFLAAQNLAPTGMVLDTLGEFARHYKVPGLPATLFIGSDGMLRSVHMGEISREALTSAIRVMTAQAGPDN